MSAERRDGASRRVRDPPGTVTVSDDGQRLRAVWHPCRGVTRTALFRVATADGVAVLEHVRMVRVCQLREPTSDLDADATLATIPEATLATIRERGYIPAEEP